MQGSIVIRYRERGGVLCATAQVADATGKPVILRAKVPLAPIRRALKRAMLRAGRTETVSGFFKRIKKLAKKVAKSKIVKGALKVHRMAGKAVRQVAKIIPPPYGTAIQAGIGIADTVKKAVRGSKAAKAVLAIAKTKARAKKRPTRRNVAQYRKAKAIGKRIAARNKRQRGRAKARTFLVRGPSGRTYRTTVQA